MTEHAENFLVRRKRREESRALTQHLVLGFGLGFFLLIVGAYKYFISQGAWDMLWYGTIWAGGIALLMTLLVPFIWRGLESVLRGVGNLVGHGVMNTILTLAYFSFIWPVGVFIRCTKGASPIYEWNSVPPSQMEGWRDKELPHDLSVHGGAGRRHRLGLFSVLTFFVRRGHVLFIPLLLLLVSLGIALFFLQTSALAPLIYTLF